MSEEVSAGLPVDRLVNALREHAAVMTAEADPQVAMRAIKELRAAALSYAHAVFDATGWGNVFNDLESDEDDDDENNDEFVVEDGVERLSLTGRWDFLVRDAEALQRLAADRLRATHPNSDDDDIAEHSEHSGGRVGAACFDGRGDLPRPRHCGRRLDDQVGRTDSVRDDTEGARRDRLLNDSPAELRSEQPGGRRVGESGGIVASQMPPMLSPQQAAMARPRPDCRSEAALRVMCPQVSG